MNYIGVRSGDDPVPDPFLIWMFHIYSWLTSHTSVHQSQDGLGDLSGSACARVCVTTTQTLVINHSVCVHSQTEWTAIV